MKAKKNTVELFYRNQEFRNGTVKAVREQDFLRLYHFDTVIATMNPEGQITINSIYYSKTTSIYTNALKALCDRDGFPYVMQEGTPADRVHYYDMGEVR